jgi:hypothetical protein
MDDQNEPLVTWLILAGGLFLWQLGSLLFILPSGRPAIDASPALYLILRSLPYAAVASPVVGLGTMLVLSGMPNRKGTFYTYAMWFAILDILMFPLSALVCFLLLGHVC